METNTPNLSPERVLARIIHQPLLGLGWAVKILGLWVKFVFLKGMVFVPLLTSFFQCPA